MADETGPDIGEGGHAGAATLVLEEESLSLTDLLRVRVVISAELGRKTMQVREVLDLRVGSVVTLDTLAGEMTDLFLNGLHLARGEVVVIGDMLHIRISEIVGSEQLSERDYV